ncbi:MAG: hypothetical protein LBT14_03830 [Treponema sp.]|jgi:hypothetical protein|nr:hypothetical protein [Treponema sp.]
MNNNQKERLTQAYYIFPLLVYIQEKITTGELTVEALAEMVDRNVQAHGHTNYSLPKDWAEMLPHLVNKLGWQIFEMPKVMAQQQEAAAQRRLQKKQEQAAKAAAKKAPPDKAKIPSVVSETPPKKKIIVVRKRSDLGPGKSGS